MKSQTQHIGNYSNVFDYNSFGAPLDGRTIENIFHQDALLEKDTIVKTIYVLEETFDVASDWQDVASYSQISYPSGKMEVKNPSSFVRLIGAKKGFTTGTGMSVQHVIIIFPLRTHQSITKIWDVKEAHLKRINEV